ncbi:hypothetical protein CYR34_07535 [Chimaeribacter arupi]|uniref:Integrase DNA-binding domain-containing protein n=1 Tax=Chimaeribacter arupi TaxID=2060066 RepID=A0A2N5EQ48_9GAMM|nr:hypothetical protein CYR34_07535 [Chimaeribacter arupi]
MVNPNGSRYWRLKYRIAGKEKLLALGVYPAVTLAAARLKRVEAKKCLADGLDPTSSKPQKNQPQQIDRLDSGGEPRRAGGMFRCMGAGVRQRQPGAVTGHCAGIRVFKCLWHEPLYAAAL